MSANDPLTQVRVITVSPTEAVDNAIASENQSAIIVASLYQATIGTLRDIISTLPADQAIQEITDLLDVLDEPDSEPRTLN